MNKKAYRNALLLFSIYLLVFILVILSIPSSGSTQLSPLIPFTSQPLEIAYISFIIFPISIIIGALIMGYLLFPLYLFIHVKISGEKMQYGYQEIKEKEWTFSRYLKAFFPALMAINFSLMLLEIPELVDLLLYEVELNFYLPALIILTSVTVGISLSLFSPIWFLQDGGISYSNVEKADENSDLIEARSLGGWYYRLLKGYAGIGVLFSYYSFFTYFIGSLSTDMTTTILLMVFFIPYPIIVAIGAIPAVILLDLTKNHRTKYVRKIAKKFGITDEIEISFKKKGQ